MTRKRSDLQKIPGIGPTMEVDLQDLGINSMEDLKDHDPEDLYHQLISQRGAPLDRCVLYVFRCAVYFAKEENHDPELLKWWNWKDK